MKTKKRRWYERRMESFLVRIFERMIYGKWSKSDSGRCNVRTFEEAMILTSNKGVVITTPDGSEFQITIVQSKNGYR